MSGRCRRRIRVEMPGPVGFVARFIESRAYVVACGFLHRKIDLFPHNAKTAARPVIIMVPTADTP